MNHNKELERRQAQLKAARALSEAMLLSNRVSDKRKTQIKITMCIEDIIISLFEFSQERIHDDKANRNELNVLLEYLQLVKGGILQFKKEFEKGEIK